jgi:flavin-dependent dehydrogenase
VSAESVDIAIVGGGPAGLTTALALVRADANLAERVVVLEKGVYPRDKYCAGAVGGRGDKILASLGARPDVPSVPIRGISFRGRMGEQAQRVGEIGRVVRRIEFDHALARIAQDRGVRILEQAPALRVEVTGHGATVATARGDYRARIVVGADGVGSLVRKAAGLGAGALRAQVLELDTERTASDPDGDLVHFDTSDRGFSGYYWDFPTCVGGRDLVCRGIYHLRTGPSDLDIRARLGARLAGMGLAIDDYKNKRFAERGLAENEPLVSGPLVLVGEAAGIDPVTGEGIAQAIEYGSLAGRFLADVLERKRELAGWTEVVNRSRLGVDLRIRRRLARTFFGPSRERVEQLLVTSPAAVRAGCRHFGALPAENRELLDVGWRTAGVLFHSVLRRSISKALSGTRS